MRRERQLSTINVGHSIKAPYTFIGGDKVQLHEYAFKDGRIEV